MDALVAAVRATCTAVGSGGPLTTSCQYYSLMCVRLLLLTVTGSGDHRQEGRRQEEHGGGHRRDNV